jgi:general secretion pathway protein D
MQSLGPWRVSRLMRATVVILQTCLLVGCSTALQKKLGASDNTPDATTSAVRNADFSSRSPTADQLPDRQAAEPSRPLLFPGSEPDSPPPRSRDSDYGVRTASLEPVTVRGDDVELNFESADIASAAKAVLGDVLHLNFAVDPKVQGTVTLASVGPIARKDLLPAFESVLRMQNAAIVHDGKFIKIVPLPEAPGHGSVSVGAGEPGFGISVVPLKYISAATVAKTAENMVARQGAIRVDPARNLLLIQGTTSEREAALDLVSTFDVEWLRNQSVGVYPLKSTSPETMIAELQRVFDNREGGPGHDVISFQPISRMNAVMVVAKSPSLLRQTSDWVERLDRSDNSGTTLRSYRLKYGNATQIAKILANIFGSNRSGSTTDSPANQLAPGTNAAQSRLDSLKSSAQGVNASATTNTNGTTNGSTTSQPGSFGSGSSAGQPISASFQSFSNKKDADASGGTEAFGGGGDASSSKGTFQNVRITADTVNNAIVVYANQEDHRIIERAVNDFDRPRLQVAIEATVAEVTLTKELTYGVQYFLAGNQNGGGLGAGFLGAAAQTAAQALAPQVAPGVNLLVGPQNSPRVILNALNMITSVKVLSSPSIVALDNEPALLEVGDEIPISTGSATILSNSNTPVVNTIQMQNTGVILKVLPHVNGNGTIELEVDQEVSAVVNPNQQTLTPTISDRHVHSTVAVSSGQTVLLGGLISDNDQRTKNNIPFVSDVLPAPLGDLLGNINNTNTRTEIIIFIRPRLIRHSIDARAVTEEFRDKLTSMKKSGNSIVSGADVKR